MPATLVWERIHENTIAASKAIRPHCVLFFYGKFSVDNDIDVSKFCEIYSDFCNCKCDTISAKATAPPFSQNDTTIPTTYYGSEHSKWDLVGYSWGSPGLENAVKRWGRPIGPICLSVHFDASL